MEAIRWITYADQSKSVVCSCHIFAKGDLSVNECHHSTSSFYRLRNNVYYA